MKKLLFAMLCIVSALGLRAQTDVTSTYITNADFESATYTTPYNPNGDRDITQPEGWTLVYKDGVSYDSSILNASQATYSSNISSQGLTIPGDGRGNQTYAVRFHNNGNKQLITLSQAPQVLPEGYYTITGLFWTQNQNEMEVGFYLGTYSTETRKKYTAGNTAWRKLSWTFTSNGVDATTIGVFFKHTSGNQMVAGVDNITLTYTPPTRPTAIALNESSLTLIPTATSTLTATITPSEADTDTEITWSSSNTSVATVAGGKVTAVAAGTATITATTANGFSATCNVTVNKAPLDNGDYYIVNVATGKAIGTIKSGWGTQAGQADHGIPFTVALGEGVYTLDSHTYNSAADHFFNGAFVDQPSTKLYITSLGSSKYSISTADGSAFVTANENDNVVANTAPNANSLLAQWYFVSKANMESALASATTANPVDATFYIQDPDFSRNHILQLVQNGKSTNNPGGETYLWKYTATNYHFKGGENGNMCAETYMNGGGKIYQELTGIKNGKYLLKAQAFHNGSGETNLYANDQKVPVKVLNANGEGTAATMNGASAAFTAGQYQNELEVFVTDGNLTIGIENASSNWACFDNFELYYLGPIVGGEATEIAMDTETAMTAGKWYYFDIPVDGLYNLTTTTLSDIVYTNDAIILIENESSVTATFSQAVNETLTAGRYFVKSASAQSLEVSVGAYAYNVGAATLSTADGGYTQSSTFTVTFPAAATSDPNATAALVASSKATVNDNEVALTAVANGFSLDLGSLTPSTDYVIAIPASVYGYADQSMNEAINVTLHTPAVFDGVYVLYDATSELFLSRGAAYGTEASMDKYGIPVHLVTDASGVSSFEFKDWTGGFLFSNNAGVAAGIFTDNNSTGWNIIETTGGYILKDANGDVYAKVDNGPLGLYVHTVAGQENANVWTLKTKTERDDIIAAYPAENISNVIDASGVATDAASFATFLDANYNATDWTSSVGTAKFYDGIAERRAPTVGSWTWTEVRGQNGPNTWDKSPAYGDNWAEVYQATGKYTQTIAASKLPAGIYKMTIDGYERHKDGESDNGFGAAGYDYTTSYLAVNREQVRLKSWYDVHTTALAAGKSGDNYPSNVGNAVECFTAGYATNEVYIYLDGSTDLTITLSKPNYTPASWLCFNNFTLTRYTPQTVSATIASSGYSTIASSYALDCANLPSGLKAYKVTGVTTTAVNLAEVSEAVAAGTGLILEGTAGQTYSIPVAVSGSDISSTNKLKAAVTATDVAANAAYILQGGQFHLVTEASTVPAGKAYLLATDVPANVRALDMVVGGDADGISAIDNAQSTGNAMFDLSGRRVAKAQKGIYIVNGKKVVK